MKKFLLLLAISLPIMANPMTCGPNLTTDGIAVQAGCPGNTYQIIVEPSTFFISFNDNPISQGILSNGYTGDGDVNDAWVTGTITTTNTPGADLVTAQWGGAVASLQNTIFIGDIGISVSSPGPGLVGGFAVGVDLPISALAGDG